MIRIRNAGPASTFTVRCAVSTGISLYDAMIAGLVALANLRDLTDDTDHRLDQLSEAITRAYFSHVPAAQTVGSST